MMRVKKQIKNPVEEKRMKEKEIKEKRSIKLWEKIMAGVLAALMLAGTVFGLLAYILG